MQIKYENIILRDMIETDIEDYVRWFTAEREWEKWDAPWEKEDTDEETERKEWTKYYESVKNRPDDAYRWKFEILWNGKHIGWVSSYCIDENYEWVGKAEEGQIVHRAVGIDICESDSWGNGIGTNALLWITALTAVRASCTRKLGPAMFACFAAPRNLALLSAIAVSESGRSTDGNTMA